MELIYFTSMKKTLQLFILLFSNVIFSQYETIDKKMDEIPKRDENATDKVATYINQNFTSEDDKIRAAFYWTSSRISYDVDNMYEPKKQTIAEKIESALKTRKGVCMHYSEVFGDIANKLGIKTYVVSGYTKQFGKIARLSHTWNVSKVNGKWCFFDVTWASGYVQDMVFYKKQNNIFYNPTAPEFLKTHMPFDYMWQLNQKPITNDDFYKGVTESKLIADSYDFNTEITQFENLTEPEKIQKKIERIEKAGLKNEFIKTEDNLLKKNLESHKNNKSIPTLELIVAEYNEANKLLNEFIHYRNSRFTPMLSDDEIKKKVQLPYDKWLYCQDELAKIVDVSKENLANFNALKRTVSTAQKRFDLQMDFVNDYLSKSPSERASAFLPKRK